MQNFLLNLNSWTKIYLEQASPPEVSQRGMVTSNKVFFALRYLILNSARLFVSQKFYAERSEIIISLLWANFPFLNQKNIFSKLVPTLLNFNTIADLQIYTWWKTQSTSESEVKYRKRNVGEFNFFQNWPAEILEF